MQLNSHSLNQQAATTYHCKTWSVPEPIGSTKEGKCGTRLFIIVAGRAEISVLSHDRRVTLYTLTSGYFFGETTLFSGVASPYQIRADGDLETLALSADTVNNMIDNKPSLAMHIGRMIESRRHDIDEARMGLGEVVEN